MCTRVVSAPSPQLAITADPHPFLSPHSACKYTNIMPGPNRQKPSKGDQQGGVLGTRGTQWVADGKSASNTQENATVTLQIQDPAKLAKYLKETSRAEIKEKLSQWPGTGHVVQPGAWSSLLPDVKIQVRYQDTTCRDSIAGFTKASKILNSTIQTLSKATVSSGAELLAEAFVGTTPGQRKLTINERAKPVTTSSIQAQGASSAA